MSGLPEGQSLKAGTFLCSHSWVILALWAGAKSCWKTPSWPLKRVVLRGFTTPYSTSSWYTQGPHRFSHLSRKNEEVSPADGTPPTKPWCRKGDDPSAPLEPSPSPHRTFEHKSYHSGGCTAPRWWRFSHPWRGCFHALFSACHWRSHCALVCQISFKAWVRRCPFNCHYAVMCRSSLMRHDVNQTNIFSSLLLFPERILTKPLPNCFESGLSPHTSWVYWPSSVFNPSEFLIIFTCLIDEHSRNFQWF